MLSKKCKLEIDKCIDSHTPLPSMDMAKSLFINSFIEIELSSEMEIELEKDGSLLEFLAAKRRLLWLEQQAVFNQNTIESMIMRGYIAKIDPTLLRRKNTTDLGGE